MDIHPELNTQRLTWDEICQRDDFRGRWVAIDDCRFDESTGKATEGFVVDVDEDLAELCSRIRESEWTNCSIVFADMTDGSMPPSSRSRSMRPRRVTN